MTIFEILNFLLNAYIAINKTSLKTSKSPYFITYNSLLKLSTKKPKGIKNLHFPSLMKLYLKNIKELAEIVIKEVL